MGRAAAGQETPGAAVTGAAPGVTSCRGDTWHGGANIATRTPGGGPIHAGERNAFPVRITHRRAGDHLEPAAAAAYFRAAGLRGAFWGL